MTEIAVPGHVLQRVRLVPRPATVDVAAPVAPKSAMRGAPARAVIMAGGRGSRLRPHTLTTPKPLVPLDGQPIVEIILRQLRAFGITHATLCVGYLAAMIKDVLGDGGHLGMSLDYAVDAEPLGTAGPLAALPGWAEPVVVMNADVLTTLNFGDLYATHLHRSAVLTVAARVLEMPISQGVLAVSGDTVQGLWEKPRVELDVCAGVYVLSAEARAAIPASGRFDMTDLIQVLLDQGRPVVAHRFTDAWHDMGTPEGLEQARRSFAEHRSDYLPGRNGSR
ncbi:sugar phosphate nucleotidyltransferase [Actinocrispum sp. NPDC049592]|uniref:sugar phosphate nucleotidyltransferase n=1 Tax=Actinocrispum sp. NPDC049592 TaxID=3154835 RepID=UPI0034492650